MILAALYLLIAIGGAAAVIRFGPIHAAAMLIVLASFWFESSILAFRALQRHLAAAELCHAASAPMPWASSPPYWDLEPGGSTNSSIACAYRGDDATKYLLIGARGHRLHFGARGDSPGGEEQSDGGGARFAESGRHRERICAGPYPAACTWPEEHFFAFAFHILQFRLLLRASGGPNLVIGHLEDLRAALQLRRDAAT